jgi:hypothetical protein
MSTTAGVFTETLLQNVRLMADAIMFNDRIKLQYSPQAEVLNALPRIQTARITPLENREKDYTVEVEWMNACGMEVTSCTSCTTCDTETSTNVQTYSLTQCDQTCFQVDENVFLTNDFNAAEAIAKGLLRADALLVESIAQYMVAVLNANDGVNVQGTRGIGTVVGNTTQIAAANWTAAAIPYVISVGQSNRFTSPVFLSGMNMYEAWLTANLNSGNDNGKGAQAMFNTMPFYFDIVNIDAVNTPTYISYLISTGALAFASKAYHTPQMRTMSWGKTYSMPSRFLPGLMIDVLVKEECTEHNLNKMDFILNTKYDILVNPTGCDGTNTGILSFTCV